VIRNSCAIIASVLISSEAAYSGETIPSYQLTSRGNIADDAYKNAIESCYPDDKMPPHGSQFIACRKQQVRSESASLDAVYSGTIEYLKSSPSQTAKLRQSQRAWLLFQNKNCGFAKALGAKDIAEEFFFDCVLKSTIDRRVELRSLVGD
jgi:uncharacterized protein YecT (DUF1311 family)